MADEYSALDMVNKRNRTMFFQNAKSRGCETIRKRFFYRVLLIGFLAIFSFSLYAQDTDNMEFWFVAPDASISHADRPTFFMITTSDKPATVTINMPANSTYFQSLFTETERTIPANSYWKFEFSTTAQMDLIENAYTSSGAPTNKGIRITSTAPVSAYYQIDGNNQKEIFTLKGKKALGQAFYMPFQTVYPISDRSAYNNQQFRQIQIVATENGTEVVIHPRTTNATFANTYRTDWTYWPDRYPTTIASNSSDTHRTRTLNKGETLLWRENARNTPNITGTRITSSKPVAVTYFEDCVQDGSDGSVDPIGDQMVPVDNLGQNYIVVKGYSSGVANDHAGILAVKEGTTIVKWRGEGETEERTRTLQQGEYYPIPLGKGDDSPKAYYIITDEPVYCMHQSATGTELGGAILPSLYSISARRIAFIKGEDSYERNAMFLIFRESAKDGFRMNGKTFAELFPTTNNYDPKSIGFDDWMYAKVDIKAVQPLSDRVCVVENNQGSFSLGYFMGSTTPTALYGYLSAFGSFSFGSDTIYACHSHTFDAPYARTYNWKLPDGTFSNLSRFETTKSGRYILTVEQDPYTIIDTTYLKVQNFNHILSAPEQLLVDKSYRFTIELNPQKDSDNYFRARYEWTFGQGASVPTSNAPAEEVFYSTPGEKTVSLRIWNYANYPNFDDYDAICDTTIYRTIIVPAISEGHVMYWKTNTANSNWNDVDNWAKDAAGTYPLSAVPSKHTRVYLPGNAVNYPSLKDGAGHTDWSHYGQPEAKEIIFRYGSELPYQHKLKYEKAYVNYNWGYYANDGADANGQPKNSWENAKKLKRDTWHILAAPLKSIASGDFSLAGYPFSWQKRFEVTTTGSVAEGNFSLTFPTNDVPLAGNNNAIAVRMAGYGSAIGYSNHRNLEGLHGVIMIPYFKNNTDTVKPYYPAHNYDTLSRKSYFYYFDTKSLKLVNSPLGSMERADEAYRFVYETADNGLPADNTYIMPLNTQGLDSSREVMVGNPLLAPLDAVVFAGENTNAIVFDQGYKLLSDDGSTWQQHYFTEGSTIPAWKAFIVTLQRGASSLWFPLEDIPALKSAAASTAPRASDNTHVAADGLSVRVLKGGTEPADGAILQYNRHTGKPDIRKMILPDGHQVPEVFFTGSNGEPANLIQGYTPGQKEVSIGVKTSDVRSRLSLEFGNMAAFSTSTGTRLILMDKHLNVRQDLTRNPVYLFTQRESGLDRQYVDRNRFVLQLSGETGAIGQEETEDGISIVYRSGILSITSDENIDTVSIYDLYGRLVFSTRSVNLTQYTHPVSLQGKLFLVRVKTASGTVKAKKVMGY